MKGDNGHASSSRHDFVPRAYRESGSAEVPDCQSAPWPEHLHRAAARVVADFQVAGAVPMSFSCRASDSDIGLATVVVELVGCRYGFGVSLSGSPAEILVALADGVQEHWGECPQTWGEARPACPGHSHPAEARIERGVAHWTCPADGRLLAPIGELR